MYVIVGLGNPGKRYANTRHNLGFMVLDNIALRNRIDVNKLKCNALVGSGNIAGQKVLLVKPQTYMNNSGEAVRKILKYYKVEPVNLIVIYDDIDIETGKMRVRSKGSAGSHNGMKSIIREIKSEEFPRVRIGIGSNRRGDLADFVTGNITSEEKEKLGDVLEKGAKATESIIEKNIDWAMSKFNEK